MAATWAQKDLENQWSGIILRPVSDPLVLRPINPATGGALAPLEATAPRAVVAAVERAKAARGRWNNARLEERITAMEAFAEPVSGG